MTSKPIDPPTLEMNAGELVDWLEFGALFDQYGIARTDALIASLKLLAEQNEENIGDADRRIEQIIESVENEIQVRVEHLGETYPFRLDDDAEELALIEDWQSEKYSFYLVCLVTSHVTGSPILKIPPSGNLLTRLRNNVFQILSTLAMAGLSRGPSISVGWPRRSGETIIELMRRASDSGAGFDVRNPPGIYIPPEEKDGGIDVMSWTAELTPPPSNLFFGQTASGNNWPGKPVYEHARVFENNYLQDIMTGNRGYATIVPFRIWDKRFWMAQNQAHRSLIDRLRLPPHAWFGLQQAKAGVMVDEASQIANVLTWLQEYRVAALA
ncbi:hypothetical protein Q1W73_17265 [Asticcacaulis sp. ZE23SCel15]|uniref:hypothetical protein n=1 Tax=Asticcacaulis sp. ZE23SCel15 TaxID=3059027 RepID=UPI00265D6985|nr:hypothetical protein [Asticcacaulis sp. ZE23SCel15]WKL57392.1 hypothetical protein Q1W73_17265 [Asticcacaulis sp. ZE23SCel15]